ncbi:hypothetical protein SORDD20_01504 [Streptococcus oralis]|nr:hypothetical protein SORDD20_01504 [Streptococcus oralis]
MLRCQNFIILNRHTFTDITFHTRKSKTYLVGKQFTNCTDTTVPKVVDIIHTSNTFSQVEEVAHLCKDIRRSYNTNLVIWIGISDDGYNTVWVCWGNNLEFLKHNWFCQNSCIVWNINDLVQVSIQVTLDTFNHATSHNGTSFYQDFTSFRIYQWLSDGLVEQACFNVEFFIDLVTTNCCQIVAAWVEETSHK